MSIPLYQVIMDDIIQKIETGVYPSGSKLPGEKEIADMYNVSRITSKRALNELEKLNYITRIQGKGSFVMKTNIKGLKHQQILFILPFANSESFGNYTAGVLKKLDALEINLHIRDSSNLTPEFMESIHEEYVGVLYYPQNAEEALELSASLIYQGVPCVLLDKAYPGLPFSSVISNNIDGAYQSTAHLIENGAKKIKFVANEHLNYVPSIMERFLGYVKAKKKVQHPFNFYEDVLIMDQETDPKTFLENLHKENVDGIVCENDLLAIKLINAMNQMNTYIPIVGFDDVQASSLLTPSLTTIRQDFEQIGMSAVQILVEEILNPDTPTQKVAIDTQLIIRNSSYPQTQD